MAELSGGSRALVGIALVFCLVSFSDLFSSNSGTVQAQKDIPQPKLAKFMAGPTIKFLYW